MKKSTFLALGLLMAAPVFAAEQPHVLKDAEQALKSGKTPQEVIEILTPAFSDPATSGLAQTYFIPGKALFGNYDELFALKQFGKLPENGDATMVSDLLDGYVYLKKALPLDTVVDAKGKTKTKYSKEIVNMVKGHHGDFNSVAVQAWELKDYAKAYKAWEDYFEVIETPAFDVKNIPADSTLAEVRFNQAIAAWQADSLQQALAAFEKSKTLGYNKKQLYDYAIAVATNLKDDAAIYAWATAGNEIFGAEEPSYLGYIINHYLQSKDFDKAFSMVDEAIAKNPGNGQYYVVKGILYDNQDKKDDAKAMFAKAIEISPDNSQANLLYGRALCNEAYALSDTAPTSPEESQKFYDEKIVPLFKEAAQYLEKAYDLDNNSVDALNYLENVYYNLHDENMMKDVEARKNK